MSATTYREFRTRVHDRVCGPARSCTCPTDYGADTLTAARRRAGEVHAKFGHSGPVEACQSPGDVICKAVWA